jgi:carbon storage regulator
MLTLDCEADQSIVIGDEVRIQVIDIIRGRVRLGITARRDIPVDREEIRRAKVREGSYVPAPAVPRPA